MISFLILFFVLFFQSYFKMLSLVLPTINCGGEKQALYNNVNYTFETVLEVGTSDSEIHLVRSNINGEIYISKVYDIYGIDQNSLNNYMNELNILKKLRNCENVIQLVDYVKSNDKLCIIVEYCEQGDLYTDILNRKMNNQMYTEEEILNIFNQILNGLSYIHKNQITHSDLKSTNIFIKNNVIKIGDFGLSNVGSNKNLGTLNCLSYESIKFNKTNKLSDLFQLGCILYELSTLSSLSQATNVNEMILFFESKNYNNIIINSISTQYSQNLINTVSKLLSLNTLERLEVVTNYNLNKNIQLRNSFNTVGILA
ncbi:NIMA related kinase 3 [Hepatocystis sp. ex Piliocolobus tephrosceles]|nr:NIMA related kinase 3 [Hepatocystis sp. ex Piliocolobus tephrosceles]